MATEKNIMRGSIRTSEPRTVGSILHELVKTSNKPLYKDYRRFLASREYAEKGGHDYE